VKNRSRSEKRGARSEKREARSEKRAVAVSDGFLTFVIEQLDGVRRISSRRLFGGVGLYSDDHFFAIIDNDTLFFKVDAATAVRYKRRRMPPFHPMPDKPPMTGYYQVPPAVLEDRDALTDWALESVDVARKAPSRSRTRRKTSTRA
jgi:DNA transformation protein and related proteins